MSHKRLNGQITSRSENVLLLRLPLISLFRTLLSIAVSGVCARRHSASFKGKRGRSLRPRSTSDLQACDKLLIAICSGTVEISYRLLLRSGLLIHLEAALLCIHVVFGGRQMGSKAAFPLPSLTVQRKDEPNQTWLKQAPWRALAFFFPAKSSGSNAARAAFPTGPHSAREPERRSHDWSAGAERNTGFDDAKIGLSGVQRKVGTGETER